MRRLGEPTIEVLIQVPTSAGQWEVDPKWSPAGQEPVYSRDDLQRVMMTYGAIVARMLRMEGPRTFRLLAHGLIIGRMIGAYQYTWHARLGCYEPDSEPWLIWDDLSEKLIKEFRAGMSTTGPLRLP